jgi:hypothetical protein
MVRTVTLALLGVALASNGIAASAACTGANPTLASVAVANVSHADGVNQYHLKGTVVNTGNEAQASNALQFVDIYQSGVKLDDKGIPPLGPGQSHTFTYVAVRSSEAGSGTTTLTFRLAPHAADCQGDSYAITF